MDNRSTKLINILSKDKTQNLMTAAQLAAELDCSVRTVKSCISNINSIQPNMIISSPKGYSIDHALANQVIAQDSNSIPQTPAERASYLMVRLIKSPVPLAIGDLCEELCISDSTLAATLRRIEKKLDTYNLSIRTSKDCIQIVGSEKNKRSLISSKLYAESDAHFVNIDTVQEAFPDLDIAYIADAIYELAENEHYFINDYSLVNLTLHLAIAIDRIQNSLTIQSAANENGSSVVISEMPITTELVNKLQEHFHITFSSNEIHEIGLLVLSRTTTVDSRSITAEDLSQHISKETLTLVNHLLSELESDFDVQLNGSDFYIRFALHINNLMLRSMYHHLNRNPLTASIKKSCPLLYDVATQLAGTIYSETGVRITDDEIAYIAFHLGSAVETQKLLETKIKVVLFCPTYYDLGNQLNNTLCQHFGSDIMITHIATRETELKDIPKPDLLLTTVPVNNSKDAPVLQIHPFPAFVDYTMIRKEIQHIRLHHLQNDFQSNLSSLIRQKFFQRSNEFKTREEVIHYMTEQLMQDGYVDEDFEPYVLSRDEMSSTAFYDYAIPHTMKMRAKKSAIYVLISDTPIAWDDTNSVHLVMLLCFSTKDRNIFNETFEPLSMVLTENLNVKKLRACTSRDEFVEFISHAPEAFPLL